MSKFNKTFKQIMEAGEPTDDELKYSHGEDEFVDDASEVDVDEDDVEDELDEVDFDLDEDETEEVDELSEKLEDFIGSFNQLNSESYLSLEQYKPTDDFTRSFRAMLNITDKTSYLDKDAYDKGTAKLALSDVFYNDVSSVAEPMGLGVKWHDGDEGEYGVIFESEEED